MKLLLIMSVLDIITEQIYSQNYGGCGV